jgi:hypothetical protein
MATRPCVVVEREEPVRVKGMGKVSVRMCVKFEVWGSSWYLLAANPFRRLYRWRGRRRGAYNGTAILRHDRCADDYTGTFWQLVLQFAIMADNWPSLAAFRARARTFLGLSDRTRLKVVRAR